MAAAEDWAAAAQTVCDSFPLARRMHLQELVHGWLQGTHEVRSAKASVSPMHVSTLPPKCSCMPLEVCAPQDVCKVTLSRALGIPRSQEYGGRDTINCAETMPREVRRRDRMGCRPRPLHPGQ